MAQCTAKSKRTGKRCRQHAIRGHRVCTTHGGTAPQVRAKANENLERQAAEKAVTRFGLPREIEPHEALMEELHRTAGMVVWLEQELKDDADGQTISKAAVGALYLNERDRLVRVAKTCIEAGIEERLVRIAEREAEFLVEFIRGVLQDLGIDPTSQKARKIVRKRLTAVSGNGSSP